LEDLRQLRKPMLAHSVAIPVGGTVPAPGDELWNLSATCRELSSPWVSEHLSFNRIDDESGEWQSGFLLPPRHTMMGVEAAIGSVRALSTRLIVPLAIETGVNYLRPRSDELPDGEFVARVAEGADCGILLDLHNVWTNARNGRQPL